jgi:hypothetical protein
MGYYVLDVPFFGDNVAADNSSDVRLRRLLQSVTTGGIKPRLCHLIVCQIRGKY